MKSAKSKNIKKLNWKSLFQIEIKIHQIVEEGFLELINNILTVGLVPALFTDEEKDGVVNTCRSAAEEEGYSASK